MAALLADGDDGSVTLWTPLRTLGHGRRSSEELITLLGEEGIGRLVDVRRYPASRRNPQLGRVALSAALSAQGVRYEWCGRVLGGRREPISGVSRHPAWNDEAFRGYADHMDSPEFRETFSHLLEVAAETPTVVLCAETLWWRCHRRLISDAAVLAGTPVVHLVSAGRSEPHRLHPAVRQGEDGWPVYDVGVQPELL